MCDWHPEQAASCESCSGGEHRGGTGRGMEVLSAWLLAIGYWLLASESLSGVTARLRRVWLPVTSISFFGTFSHFQLLSVKVRFKACSRSMWPSLGSGEGCHALSILSSSTLLFLPPDCSIASRLMLHVFNPSCLLLSLSESQSQSQSQSPCSKPSS